MIISLSSNQNLSDDNGCAAFEYDLLTHYGTCIARYYGYGELTLKGGDKLSCKFEAGQLSNGDAIMLCDFTEIRILTDLSEASFEGKTLRGHKIIADRAINIMNYLPKFLKGDQDLGSLFFGGIFQFR